MIYLNLPLKLYLYLLYISIVITAVIGYRIVNKIQNNINIQIISLWLLVLLEINMLNMVLTLRNYMSNSIRIGPKGKRGNIGHIGYKGKSNVCNQCGSSGLVRYGGNINDYSNKVSDPQLKMGQCKFPFVFENEYKYDCVKANRVDDLENDAMVNGWCATELNGDRTYKTFGYCKDSNKKEKIIKTNIDKQKKKEGYLKQNSGILDLKVISGIRSSIKCPKKYKKINVDLNLMANGNFVYMCKKEGLGDIGIQEIKLKTGGETCNPGFTLLDKDLNDGYPGLSPRDKINVCVKKGSSKFIKDMMIQKDKKCQKDYISYDINLNKNIGGDEIYLCTSTEVKQGVMVDAVFRWGVDNNIYFFKDDKYWKYDTQKKVLGEVSKITSFWGKLPSGIDAVFTNPYDNKTYFFKGSRFYQYDYKNQKISDGYPKLIKDVWKNVPDNIDGVLVDRDKNIYFIYKKEYFKWNNIEKEAEPPMLINRKWIDCPSNMSAMFYYKEKKQTYVIVANKVYKFNKNKLDSSSPNDIGIEFGLI